MLPDPHIGLSRGRSGGLVFPSLSEFSTVDCDPHSQRFGIVTKAEIDAFLEISFFFDDPALDSLNWSLDGAMLLIGKNVVPGAMW